MNHNRLKLRITAYTFCGAFIVLAVTTILTGNLWALAASLAAQTAMIVTASASDRA